MRNTPSMTWSQRMLLMYHLIIRNLRTLCCINMFSSSFNHQLLMFVFWNVCVNFNSLQRLWCYKGKGVYQIILIYAIYLIPVWINAMTISWLYKWSNVSLLLTWDFNAILNDKHFLVHIKLNRNIQAPLKNTISYSSMSYSFS